MDRPHPALPKGRVSRRPFPLVFLSNSVYIIPVYSCHILPGIDRRRDANVSFIRMVYRPRIRYHRGAGVSSRSSSVGTTAPAWPADPRPEGAAVK